MTCFDSSSRLARGPFNSRWAPWTRPVNATTNSMQCCRVSGKLPRQCCGRFAPTDRDDQPRSRNGIQFPRLVSAACESTRTLCQSACSLASRRRATAFGVGEPVASTCAKTAASALSPCAIRARLRAKLKRICGLGCRKVAHRCSRSARCNRPCCVARTAALARGHDENNEQGGSDPSGEVPGEPKGQRAAGGDQRDSNQQAPSVWNGVPDGQCADEGGQHKGDTSDSRSSAQISCHPGSTKCSWRVARRLRLVRDDRPHIHAGTREV
jgi:hypothetical protein